MSELARALVSVESAMKEVQSLVWSNKTSEVAEVRDLLCKAYDLALKAYHKELDA